MGLIVRVVDEITFGLRDLDIDELRDVALIWSLLNDGATPSEIALRAMPDCE